MVETLGITEIWRQTQKRQILLTSVLSIMGVLNGGIWRHLVPHQGYSEAITMALIGNTALVPCVDPSSSSLHQAVRSSGNHVDWDSASGSGAAEPWAAFACR